MSSKTTATKDNALSKQEVDDRLGATALARMATYRPDGMIHLTPIWYHWNGSQFRLTLGAGRIHLKNLAANNRVSLVIDEDPRLEKGIAAGAWAIMCRGTAELSQDEDLIREVTHAVLGMALGEDDANAYTEPVMAEGRTIVIITPHEWTTWDYNKSED